MINVVRDGQLVVPTCDECGCRLEITVLTGINPFGYLYLMQHFSLGHEDLDARGCRCPALNETRYLKGVAHG